MNLMVTSLLLAASISVSLQALAKDDFSINDFSLQAALGTGVLYGQCSTLGSMFGFQKTAKIEGGDRFVAMFSMSEISKLGMTPKEFQGRCDTAIKLSKMIALAEQKNPVSGGDGSSIEQAIFINAADNISGIEVEYAWLKRNYTGYKEINRTVIHSDVRSFDHFEIVLPNGEKRSVYFDITKFLAKPFK